MTHSQSHSNSQSSTHNTNNSIETPLFDSYDFYGSEAGSARLENTSKKALSLPFGKVGLPAVAAALALAPASERIASKNPKPAPLLNQNAAA
jgi:hypothetical protein